MQFSLAGKVKTSFFTSSIKKMLNIIPIPALSDNYMYLVIDEITKECAVVDPVEPEKVIENVEKKNLKLTTVLTTHHHWDHAGGNENLLKKCKNLRVFGGDDRIPELTDRVTDGSLFKIGTVEGRCIFTPCHTSGHICYFMADETKKCVFTGDTLFLGGCGRFFEGTAQQMYDALITKLGALPDDTQVFCGHEYTVQNLTYAKHAEPTNKRIVEKLEWAKKQRGNGQFTIPSTISEEKSYNPFMRVNEPSLQSRAKSENPVEVMQYLRDEKNSFKS